MYLVQALGQVGRCIAACVAWCNQLLTAFAADNLLLFIFFIGAVVALFIRPIIGFGINAIGADTVNAVYGRYKFDRDLNKRMYQKDINRYADYAHKHRQ